MIIPFCSLTLLARYTVTWELMYGVIDNTTITLPQCPDIDTGSPASYLVALACNTVSSDKSSCRFPSYSINSFLFQKNFTIADASANDEIVGSTTETHALDDSAASAASSFAAAAASSAAAMDSSTSGDTAVRAAGVCGCGAVLLAAISTGALVLLSSWL
jgi:hypothetical protein